MRCKLLRPDPRRLHDARVLVALGLDECGELIDRHRHDVDAGVVHLLPDVGQRERVVDRLVQRRDHVGWRVVRREEAAPQAEIEILDPGRLGDGRHVGRHRGAARGRDRQHLHLPGVHERQRGGEAGEIEVDVAPEQVGKGRGRALVGHVRHGAVARELEQLAGEMPGRAGARGGKQQALRALRGLEHVGHGRVRRALRHHERERHHAAERDRREIARDVEPAVEERRVDGDLGRLSSEDGVAVGRRLRDVLRRDQPARAGAVLDHDGAAEFFRELGADDAGDEIAGAARRVADDERDGAGRVGLRGGGKGEGKCCEERRDDVVTRS